MRKLQESTSAEFWDGVLGLEEFEVVHYASDVDEKVRRMTVVPRVLGGLCPHCRQASSRVHQTRDREHIHDLPIGDCAVELRVRVPEFWCDSCDRAFTPVFRSLVKGTHATERFLERCAALIRVSDVANAAQFFHVAEKNLERWYYDYVSRRQEEPPQPAATIRSLGIDEISQKKGRAVSSP
jgi:transposase